MKVLHVITGVGQGGAEAVMYRLIAATQPEIKHSVVFLLREEGVYGEKLRKIGVEVKALNMTQNRLRFSNLRQLRRIILDYHPDLVQTSLYHADLLGGMVAFFAGVPVVWVIHSTDLGTMTNTWKTRIIRRICAVLSGFIPSAIITVSQKSAQLHASLGYVQKKALVISNGVDPSLFHYDEIARHQVRQELKIPSEEFLIGSIARWHPLKDHANLLKALSMVRANKCKFFCLLTGSGMTPENDTLMDLIDSNGLKNHVILLGPRSDVAAVMNAVDLHVLSSCAESLPVAVIEAMACGTPCVVTDVGDAALIVGDTGWVVPPRSPEALAVGIESAMKTLEEKGRNTLSRLCRERSVQNFSLDKMIREYIKLWKTIAKQ